MTQLTDEEKQAQAMAMLDEEKAEFEVLSKKVIGDVERMAGRARLLAGGIKLALPIALLLLVLPFFIDLSLYWFAAITASIGITFIYVKWQMKRIRRRVKEWGAVVQQKHEGLRQKKDALKASWE